MVPFMSDVRLKQITDFIKINPECTYQSIAENLQINKSTVCAYLKQLKERQSLEIKFLPKNGQAGRPFEVYSISQ